MAKNKKGGDFYFNLLEKKKRPLSQVGKRIKEDSFFQQLLATQIIVKEEKRGRGNLILNKEAAFQKFLQQHFPGGDTRGKNAATNRIESTAKYCDSKVASEKIPIAWLRGQQPIRLNGHHVDLPSFCQRFRLFSAVIKSLHCQHLCFVENKEAFLKAEQVIPAQYTFLHPYGRVGEALMKTIKAETIMVFSDYDYIGLNEYLLIKEHLPQATFFIPDNFESLHSTYAKPINNENSGEAQKKSARIKQSQDPTVRRVCKTIETTNKFLEQEALFIHEV